MAGLTYVGKSPSEARDVETRVHTETVLNGGLSRSYVTDRVNTLMASRATKVYTDQQDALYADVNYYPTKDALLVPNSALGVAAGAAKLGSDSKVPAAQTPVLGAGILQGPFGPDTYFGGTTSTTPLKIAQWNAFPLAYTGQLLAWANLSAQSVGGRVVIEIRAGTSTQTAYADQTLIAQGYGRQYFDDYQMITVVPVTATNGAGQDGNQQAWPTSTQLLVNMWMYDDANGQSTTATGLIVSAPLFVARTTL